MKPPIRLVEPSLTTGYLTRLLALLGVLVVVLSACAPAPAGAAVEPSLPATATSQPTLTPSQTARPPTSLPPTSTPEPPEPTATLAPALCSPLEGFTLGELSNILSNPYAPPSPGSDNPHHGIDLSFYRYGDRLGMLGLPVYAALSGTAAMVTEERFPYGYALIVETPLEQIPQSWLEQLSVPTPAPTLALVNNPLTCPTPEVMPAWNTGKRSLYLLYAHMEKKPGFQLGDPVRCGQQIGTVGNSGNSINEHLHFEVRVGPAGARFTSMDHYDNAASAEEMFNYCTWRISEQFQKIDPTLLLFLKP